MRGSPGSITGHIEEADCLVVVAVVGGANRQENPNSDVQLQPSDCTQSQVLKGGKAEDVDLDSCVCDSLGVDLRGICSLGDFGFAWGCAVGLWTLRCTYVSSWSQRATGSVGEGLG